MEKVAGSSETSDLIYYTARSHVPDDHSEMGCSQKTPICGAISCLDPVRVSGSYSSCWRLAFAKDAYRVRSFPGAKEK